MSGRGALIVWFAVLLLAGFFAWEWYLSPEAKVRRTIEGAASAAEAGDVDRFSAYLASDYSDYLHTDRAMLEERLTEGFGRVDRLNVTVQAIEVEAELEPGESDGEMKARFDLVVVAVRGEERYVVVGTPFQPEKIEAWLVPSPEGYRIQRVARGTAVP
jgi:hypothetical protein